MKISNIFYKPKLKILIILKNKNLIQKQSNKALKIACIIK